MKHGQGNPAAAALFAPAISRRTLSDSRFKVVGRCATNLRHYTGSFPTCQSLPHGDSRRERATPRRRSASGLESLDLSRILGPPKLCAAVGVPTVTMLPTSYPEFARAPSPGGCDSSAIRQAYGRVSGSGSGRHAARTIRPYNRRHAPNPAPLHPGAHVGQGDCAYCVGQGQDASSDLKTCPVSDTDARLALSPVWRHICIMPQTR
jgi:hypothetical protein